MKSLIEKAKLLSALGASVFLAGCAVGLSGDFIPQSYAPAGLDKPGILLGKVHAESCQKQWFYVLPKGEAISTNEAIQLALKQKEGTSYLANISIGSIRRFHFGYSYSCIEVDADAYSQVQSPPPS